MSGWPLHGIAHMMVLLIECVSHLSIDTHTQNYYTNTNTHAHTHTHTHSRSNTNIHTHTHLHSHIHPCTKNHLPTLTHTQTQTLLQLWKKFWTHPIGQVTGSKLSARSVCPSACQVSIMLAHYEWFRVTKPEFWKELLGPKMGHLGPQCGQNEVLSHFFIQNALDFADFAYHDWE